MALRVAAAIDFFTVFLLQIYLVILYASSNIQVDGLSGILTALKVQAKW